MKKIIIAIIFAFVSVASFAQTTKSEIIEGFKDGVFWLKIEQGSHLLFSAEIGSERYNIFDEIVSAKFTTKMGSELTQKGNEWFIAQMKDETMKDAVWDAFYETFKIVLWDDFVVNEDGSATITMSLTDK